MTFGIHDVLENVVHRDDVVLPDVSGQIGVFEGAFDDVVSPSPTFGRHLWVDLDARGFEVEEPAQLVEVAAIAGADVKEMTGRGP